MKIILTNDDGIDAPGLAALAEAASGLGELTVVAPTREWSGCSHRVTTDGPMRIREDGPRRFAVDGTPADCVRVALHALVPDAAWVVSGINRGGNLGADILHSGTAAAAREAVLHGRRSIAVSHYVRKGMTVDWRLATSLAAPVIARLMAAGTDAGHFWNVNLPHLDPGSPRPAEIACAADPSPLPLHFTQRDGALAYSGDYHRRARLPGMDVDVCFSGNVAVCRVGLW